MTDLNNIDISYLSKKNDTEIIESIGMANLPLIVHIFSKKYNNRVVFTDIGNDCMITYGNTNIANMSYLATHLHFLDIKNDVMEIYGNTSIPYDFRDYCEYKILINGNYVKYETFDLGLNQYFNGDCYELRKGFRIEIDLSEYKNISIDFEIITNGIKSKCNKINSYRFMPVADIIENQYKEFEKYIVKICKNKVVVKPLINKDDVVLCEKKYRNALKKINSEGSLDSINIRKEYFEKKLKKTNMIWLFFDRYDKADDNGEVLFEYVCKRNYKNVDAYFIISIDSPDYRRLSKIGKVIPAFSDEHKLLLFLADYVFTSQLNGFVENPFGKNCEYYRDLYHDSKVVFLQHGVTKDDQSKWLHKYKHNMHAIVVSSTMEKTEFLRDDYGLKEEQVWLTGMPRFDRLYHNENKQILIMPTWRKSFMMLKKDESLPMSRWIPEGEIEKSKYIKKYNNLLNSKIFHYICAHFNYKVIFVPHPLSRPYEDLFKVPKWIKKCGFYEKYNDIFAESNLMITDYSSVAFDFAYLNKPVIYYQFDKKNFFTNHTYSKGYFEYKRDGFGAIASNIFILMKCLYSSLNDNCKLDTFYENNIKSFFEYTDNNNCKRIIKNILDGEQYNEFVSKKN